MSSGKVVEGSWMEEARYRLDDFELYRSARQFRCHVYVLIKQLPKEEKFALDPQMRRAAVSISNNIAEGHGRWHYQENAQLCRVAGGSTEEIIDDINVCLDEGYGDLEYNQRLKNEAYSCVVSK
jgi:four helix bundle protein